MGNCVSGCFGAEERKISNVFLSPLIQHHIPSSDKHDDKFYFIRNEDEINKTIDLLEESIINDPKAILLESTLVSLRNQKNKLTLFPSYDSADNIVPVKELDEEQETSPTDLQKSIIFKQETPTKLRRPHTVTNFTDFSFGKTQNEIVQGNLLIEVQKGHFLHPQLLSKYGVGKPYVIVKIYRTEKEKGKTRAVKQNNQLIEVAKFQTLSASNAVKSSWDELFEYRINDDKKISSYSFGFTLCFLFDKDSTIFQMADEQVYSVSSLMDQEMQIKQIDFKDSDYKGVLARVKVRFQLVHDQELLKEKIVKDIRTKMERLYKIRERHPIFQYERREPGSFMESVKKSHSRRDSQLSQSSTHENDETGYYVA